MNRADQLEDWRARFRTFAPVRLVPHPWDREEYLEVAAHLEAEAEELARMAEAHREQAARLRSLAAAT